MGRLTKQQERALFIAEFVRRLRAAAPGEGVYMRVDDVFKDADVTDKTAARSYSVGSAALQGRPGVITLVRSIG